MGAMGAMGEEGGGAAASLVDVEKAKQRSSSFGEGVTFVSAKEVSGADGRKGARTIYAFTDVTKLKIDPMSAMQNMGNQPGAEVEDDESKDAVTFDWRKGKTAELIVNLPQDNDADDGDADDAEDDDNEVDVDEEVLGADPAGAQMEAMMRQMFDGMRIRFVIMVDGEIEKTNASYVETNKKTGKKQLVSIYDMNLGTLIKDAEKFKKLQDLKDPKDSSAMKNVLKQFPEMKIETEEKLSIKFK